MRNMQPLKVDISKLITPANYAKLKGMKRELVYYEIKANKLDSIKIDGVPFVWLK